jgi:hypothetical protein
MDVIPHPMRKSGIDALFMDDVYLTAKLVMGAGWTSQPDADLRDRLR